jgi:hypothetical protein
MIESPRIVRFMPDERGFLLMKRGVEIDKCKNFVFYFLLLNFHHTFAHQFSYCSLTRLHLEEL